MRRVIDGDRYTDRRERDIEKDREQTDKTKRDGSRKIKLRQSGS